MKINFLESSKGITMISKNIFGKRNNKDASKQNLEFSIVNRKGIKTYSTEFLKFLFLNDKNTDVTKNFLSSLMTDVNLPKIKAIQIHSMQPFITKKNEVFNLNILDEKGQYYNLEIMNESEDDCVKRSMYFWAKRFTATIYDGNNFSGIMPTISITFTEKKVFAGLNKFHWCFLPLDIQNRLVSLDSHQQIHFIELNKFVISKDEDYISYLKKGNYPIIESFFSWMLFFKEGWRRDFVDMYDIVNPYILSAKEEYEKFVLQQGVEG